MPANVAHLLICNKAVKILQDGGEYEEFINILDADERKPYLNLGSIGPDLSYYGSQWEGMKSLLLGKSLGSDLNIDIQGQNERLSFFRREQEKISIIKSDPEDPHIEIENSLFGWRLKIGKKAIDCSSEAQASYLRVFAEMGCDQTLVPKDDAYLSSIVNHWESLFEKAQAALQEYTSSILQSKTRDLLIHTVWATLREQMS